MRIACLQFDIVWENKSANHGKVRALLESARLPKTSFVLLPEMFASGFSMNISAISDTVPGGETERFLSQAAKDFGLFILAGVVTNAGDGRGRNEALLHGPDGALITRYQKIHPFTLGGETQHYSAGSDITIPKVN